VSSDRRDYVRGSPESPPPYSGDTQLWAEDLDNYLRRRMQKLEQQTQKIDQKLESLDKRVKELEKPIPAETSSNGIDNADGTAVITDQ